MPVDVPITEKDDAIATDVTGRWSHISLLKYIASLLGGSGGVSSRAGSITASGSTIATGGTSQLLRAAASAPRYFTVQNQSTGALGVKAGSAASMTEGTGTLYLSAATSATSGDGGTLTFESDFVANNALYIIGAATGQAYSTWEG